MDDCLQELLDSDVEVHIKQYVCEIMRERLKMAITCIIKDSDPDGCLDDQENLADKLLTFVINHKKDIPVPDDYFDFGCPF